MKCHRRSPHSGRGRLAATLILASCLAASGFALAVTPVTVCVTDSAGLQAELTAAQGRTAPTFINVARGFYSTGGTTFTFYNPVTAQGQLDVTGGYDSTCTATAEDPSLTVVDGGGTSPVMNLESLGGISVRWLTIQNGKNNGGGSAGLSVESTGAGVIVHYNIIRDNISVDINGGLFAGINTTTFGTSSAGNVDVSGNLIVHNTAANDGAAGAVGSDGTGAVYVVNNTVSGNIVTANGIGLVGGLYVSGPAPGPYVSNNIFYANTANTYDLYLYGNASVLYSNDVQNRAGSIDAGSTGNVSIDPRFVGGDDFRLLPGSPVRGVGAHPGTLTPAGGIGLASIDLKGNPRTYSGVVDMGAYSSDDLLRTGFEY